MGNKRVFFCTKVMILQSLMKNFGTGFFGVACAHKAHFMALSPPLQVWSLPQLYSVGFYNQ